jgi:hypothetical protein
MRNTTHATARSTETKTPVHAAPCAPDLPFCGLGDLGCLASRIATCSGLTLREDPLAPREAQLRSATNS